MCLICVSHWSHVFSYHVREALNATYKRRSCSAFREPFPIPYDNSDQALQVFNVPNLLILPLLSNCYIKLLSKRLFIATAAENNVEFSDSTKQHPCFAWTCVFYNSRAVRDKNYSLLAISPSSILKQRQPTQSRRSAYAQSP
jgi:hypothetical protein